MQKMKEVLKKQFGERKQWQHREGKEMVIKGWI
jgi:hypothetical protein